MTDFEMLQQLLRDFVKPIITEALAEFTPPPAPVKERRFYTREEACRLLHIGTTTFYRLAQKGKIVILKIEGKTLVDADDLDEAIETRSVFRYQR